MATENSLECVTFEAGQDLSSKQYFFVTQAANDGQVDPTGDGLLANGILQNNPDVAGKAATVAIKGVSKLVAGGTFGPSSLISSDSTGRGIAAGSGDYPLARALAGAVVGDIVSVQLMLTAATI